MIKANSIDAGLAVGADIAKGAPADALEYTAAAGAAAFILADAGKFPVIAEIKETISYTTDTADFWREEGSLYPVHAGRFSGTSYQRTVSGAIKLLLEKTQLRIEEFDHVVLHMPNGKLPKVVAAKLGVTEQQLSAGFVVPLVGNTYAACSLIGLAAVLEKAKPNQKILLCSYGSGSGSDAFYIETTPEIASYKSINKLSAQIENKKNISYTEYKLIEAKKYD
jgi:hydroxymethylglutaryl-CoA synthase